MSYARKNDIIIRRRGAACSLRRTQGISAAIFIVALIVRLIPLTLSLYVTPDEPIWVYRSARLLQALKGVSGASFPETGHPGVTTMVLGAVGIQVMLLLRPAEAGIHWEWIASLENLAPENSVAMRHLVYFLPASRVVVALVTSVGLVAVYLVSRKALGERMARLLSVLLALDPFYLGYSGILHTDALQATFVLLSALLTLTPLLLGHERRTWLALTAGAFLLALAGLTKTLGLLAAPGIALALLIGGCGPWTRRIGYVAMFGILTALFFLGGYPPVWRKGWEALMPLIDAFRYHEGIGLRPVFFMGQMRTDAGPFFYPVVLMFKMSAPMVLGVIGAGAGFLREQRKPRLTLLSFVCPALIYLLGLSFGTKKFGRYALTVTLLLAPVAASYWARLRALWQRTLVVLLLLAWPLTAVTPFLSANLLLGGPWIAKKIIPLGWGEATGIGAHKLNTERPPKASASLMVANVPGAAGIFRGEVRPWDDEALGCTDFIIGGDVTPEGYAPVDEIVVAGLQLTTVFSRAHVASLNTMALSPGPLPGVSGPLLWPSPDDVRRRDWLSEHLTVGDPFLWFHAARCHPLTEMELERLLAQAIDTGVVRCEPGDPVAGFSTDLCILKEDTLPQLGPLARFGGLLDLQAAYWPAEIQAPMPLNVSLRWIPTETLPELDIYLALRAEGDPAHMVWMEGGQRLLSTTGWAPPAWAHHAATDGEATTPLSPALAPGRYELFLGLSGPEGWLGVTNPDGSFGGIQFKLGMVDVKPPSFPVPELSLPETTNLDWPGLHVLGLIPPPATLLSGEYLAFTVGFERVKGSPPEYLKWHMICQGGEDVVGSLSWGPTHPETWPVGHRYVVPFSVRVPPGTSEGHCRLLLSPGDFGPETSALAIGEMAVQQRPRAFEQVAPKIRASVRAGDLAELVGGNWEDSGIPGTDFPVTLYWRVTGTADTNLTVFVHLVDENEKIWAQSDAWPMQGHAPTLTWIPGELIVDRHTLALPSDMPEGTYQLYVGLYDAFQGQRVALYREGIRLNQDRALVGTLQVTR